LTINGAFVIYLRKIVPLREVRQHERTDARQFDDVSS